jgi:histidine triad (HIT) family protein
VKGIENEHNAIKQTDLVYRNDIVTAFIGLRSWPNNPGHVLTIPNEHYENIYDLPLSTSWEVQKTAKTIALAMKEAYLCDGVMLIQRNEPAAGQRAWHYHLHIIPRYENDNWDLNQRQSNPAAERAEFAQKLRTRIDKHLYSSKTSKHD